MIVLAILFVFAAVFFLVLGLSYQTENPMTARIATLRGDRTMDYRTASQTESITTRIFAPLANSLGSKVESFLPAHWIANLDTRLVQAGQPISRTGFLVAVVLVEAFILLFAFVMATSSGDTLKGPTLFGAIAVLLVIGAVLPRTWLDNRVRFRQTEILKSLPDAFDLITTCVEAGLGIEAALAKVSEKVEGSFGTELAIMMREVSMGKLRRDALKEMGERTGVHDLISFINAVIQAESMGTSIATVLRVQADQMRIKRRQRAEQQAQQAPIKMMFPLVLCIFPSLFIVILGPAGITIYEQFISRG